jgi:hypothetical protein
MVKGVSEVPSGKAPSLVDNPVDHYKMLGLWQRFFRYLFAYFSLAIPENF